MSVILKYLSQGSVLKISMFPRHITAKPPRQAKKVSPKELVVLSNAAVIKIYTV